MPEQNGVRLAYASAGSGYPLVKAANWRNHLNYEWNSPLWKHWIEELGAFWGWKERAIGNPAIG